MAEWEKQGFEVRIQMNDPVDGVRQHPGVGRNKSLREFYKGDDEWCILADDDTYLLHTMFDTATFVEDPIPILNKFDKDLRTVVPFFSGYYGFNPACGWWGANEQYSDHWVVERDFYITSKCIIHRNGDPIYFREDMILEDPEWGVRHAEMGYRCGVMPNIMLHETCWDNTSIAEFTNEGRGPAYAEAKDKLLELHPTLSREENDTPFTPLNTHGLIKKYWKPSSQWQKRAGAQGVQQWVKKSSVIDLSGPIHRGGLGLRT